MGLLDSIFGGGGGGADDPYADILTPAQRNHMQAQGLLAMAGAFAAAGMPSRLPVPFGSALGSAAAALGTGQEAGMKTAIENALAAQKVRDLRAKAGILAKLNPLFQQALDEADKPVAAPLPAGPGIGPPGAGVRPGGAAPAAAPGAGGGGPLAAPIPSLAGGGLLGPSPDAGAAGEYGVGQTQGADVGAAGEYGGGQAVSPVGRLANQTGTDYLSTLASAAAPYALPPGYSIAMTSGARPGATVAGTGGRSQHADANAGDFVIKDDKGQAIPNKGEDTSGHYGRLAQTMRQLADPAVRQQLAWGGNFTTGGDNAPRDLMHFDLAGDRGRYGTLAAAAQGAGLLGPEEATPAPGGGLLAPATQVAGAAPLTGSAWEAANNNLGGLRRPGVPAAGPSQGGFQSFGSPQEGLAAISNQLNRYASGATTGTPLTTVRQIVSTWAPPNENDTPALIQRASQVVGVHPDQPLDVSNPAVKAKLIEATIRNEQGGRLPIDQQMIQQAAALPGPDQVIPSGPGAGGNLPVMQAQYQPQGGGLAAPSTLPQLAAPGTLPPLAAPGGTPALGAGGKIPGLNMTPQKLAIIDAMAEAAGLGNPFKGLLDTYYKSPGYLQESAGATARGRIAEEEPSQLRVEAVKARNALLLDMSKNALTLDDKGNVVEIPGMRQMLGKTAAEIEEAKQRATSQFQTVEATVLGPNGERTPQKMTQYEFTYREQQRAKNAAMGLPAQPGDIVSAATPESTKSAELGVTAGWKALETTHAAELAANRSDQQLGQIAQAMKGFTPGKTAEWRLTWGQYLKDAGFKIDGVSDGEIMQQAQRRLQLAAANVHEGSVSNFERSIFGETVTQLTNTPEGIVKAIDIQQRLNDYDRKVAQIHRDTIVNGVPNLVEAQKRIAKLGSPLSPGELSALQEIRAGKVPGRGDAATAPLPAGAGAIKTPYGTITPVQ